MDNNYRDSPADIHLPVTDEEKLLEPLAKDLYLVGQDRIGWTGPSWTELPYEEKRIWFAVAEEVNQKTMRAKQTMRAEQSKSEVSPYLQEKAAKLYIAISEKTGAGGSKSQIYLIEKALLSSKIEGEIQGLEQVVGWLKATSQPIPRWIQEEITRLKQQQQQP